MFSFTRNIFISKKHIKLFFLIFFFLTFFQLKQTQSAFAISEPQLININKVVKTDSSPTSFVTIGDTIYFSAYSSDYGRELWKSDGTEAGTVLVKDINFGLNDGLRLDTNNNFTVMDNTLYFQADGGTNGIGLWKSDGTEAGTVLVKTIQFAGSDAKGNFTVINNTLYFAAYTSDAGFELWKSDGTEAGTVMVKDIYPGSNDGFQPYSYKFFTAVVDNTLYFQANDGTNGMELWKSDGTEAGTVMVKDIYPGSAGAYPAQLTAVGNTLYFSAGDNIYGRELWKSDGTEAGTVMVKDITHGLTELELSDIVGIGDTFYFKASDGVNGIELWKSDGTEAGTVMVKDINSSGDSLQVYNNNGFTIFGSTLYFQATDGTNGAELWKSDGTEAGTVMVKDIYPGSSDGNPVELAVINTTLFFRATDSASGYKLWKSDGTEAGTVIVKVLNSDSEFSLITGGNSNFTVLNNALYFLSNDGVHGQELWKSDGTEAGTVMVKDICFDLNLGSDPFFFTLLNNTLYFQASDGIHGTELWKSDGTEAGTVMIKDINPDSRDYNGGYGSLIFIGNTVYFTVDDGTNGTELWKSDGTGAGTVMVKDILVGPDNSNPQYLTVVGDTLYFQANDGVHGQELWKSDGTEAGTVMVKDVYSGANSNIENLTAVGNILYFKGDDGVHGQELWKSDGTEAGTVMVKDILVGPDNSNPQYLTAVNNTLYFNATNGTNGYELWKSDGTEAGTVMVKDIWSGSGDGFPESFTLIGNTLYFSAYDDTHGTELWKSDGTEAGPVMIKDINPGTGDSYIVDLIALNNNFYFSAYNDTFGRELWKSDGTEGGTVMVKDIYPGNTDYYTYSLVVVGNNLYFSTSDGVNGRELWKSDGTEGGTIMVKDIWTGSNEGYPDYLTTIGNKLYFNANDGTNGIELWSLVNIDSTTPSIPNIIDSTITNNVGGGITLASTTSNLRLDIPSSVSSSLSSDSSIDFQIKEIVSGSTITDVSTPTASDELVSSLFDLKAYQSVGTSISSFDQPLTLTIDYTDDQISGLDPSTLFIYRYDDGVWQKLQTTVDLTNHQLIADTYHFSLFAIFGQPASITPTPTPTSTPTNNSSSSNTPSTPPSYSCTDSKPLSNSNLFQIDITNNTAKLFFTPLTDTNHYYVSFSANPDAEKDGAGADIILNREGVQSYTVYQLKPNTTYYFKVRGQNGCMPGNWSNIMKIKTNTIRTANPSVFYKNTFTKAVSIVKSVKNIVLPQTNTNTAIPTITPAPQQTTITPAPSYYSQNTDNTNTPNETPVVKAKKCFLWWCW